jgi:endo-1,4-beta-D-glucanase Y
VPRIRWILLAIATVAMFPGCGHAAQSSRPIPKAPSQAYGMLVAAALGDSARFDQIWGWTKANLRRPDGLLAFHWVDGAVRDHQAASDADLDASRALLVAGCLFKRGDLRAEAGRIRAGRTGA